MSRKDIAKKLGVSMGSVNVYCNGAAQSSKTVKAAETSKKKTEIPVSNNWKELLKESVSAYISENVFEIISGIPIQEIVNKAISEKMKNVAIGGPAPAKAKKARKLETNTVETNMVEKTEYVPVEKFWDYLNGRYYKDCKAGERITESPALKTD
jgi:predicted transcriptional regulator